MNKGKFIVFEGIDGAGKSTQVALLKNALEARGRRVAVTAEPTELPSGRALRKALSGADRKSECEMAVMFVADRIAHNISEGGINALCDSGCDVICDRYYYSTLAYHGQSTDYAWVKSMNLACPEIRRPDLCIYLDLTPEQSLARISGRGEAVEIYENLERLTSVRAAFHSVIDDLRSEGERIFAVRADRTPEEIADEILAIVTECGI
jgi:dTMP kinase